MGESQGRKRGASELLLVVGLVGVTCEVLAVVGWEFVLKGRPTLGA